ncbi:MAG: translation initiation factor IF-2 N-terminal domain-containing protein, partial [Clostridia bacterium]|nr:translation initiation factor IF-2 N-terminal domain-containing protein [Clostridia bacterium]
MLEKIKVSQLAKDLAVSSKEVAEILEQHGVAAKSHATVMDEIQLNIVLEVMSQKFDKGGAFKIPTKKLTY